MCISGPPAGGPNLHVSFSLACRLTVHCYKKFIAGPPADGSQRVKMDIVSSRDTDDLLILVSHIPIAQCEHLWMMSGTSKKRCYIQIDAVFNNLPQSLYTALLPFHALTGCDTTSYFANHKQSSWKVFKVHHNLLNNLGIGG